MGPPVSLRVHPHPRRGGDEADAEPAAVGRSCRGSERYGSTSASASDRTWLRERTTTQQRRNKCARFKNNNNVFIALPFLCAALSAMAFHCIFRKGKLCPRWRGAPAGRTTAQNSSNDPQSVSKTLHTRWRTDRVVVIGLFFLYLWYLL